MSKPVFKKIYILHLPSLSPTFSAARLVAEAMLSFAFPKALEIPDCSFSILISVRESVFSL